MWVFLYTLYSLNYFFPRDNIFVLVKSKHNINAQIRITPNAFPLKISYTFKKFQ